MLEFCDRGALRDLLAVALDSWPGAATTGGAHATSDPQLGGQPETSFSQQQRQQQEQQQEQGGSDVDGGGSAAAPLSGGGSGSGPTGPPGPVRQPGSTAAGEGSAAAAAGAAASDSICPLGYAAVLDTCLDVARAMLHMHSESIVHGDLKARNILLKSGSAGDGRNYVAKVGIEERVRVLVVDRMGRDAWRCMALQLKALMAGAVGTVLVDGGLTGWGALDSGGPAVGALAWVFPGSWVLRWGGVVQPASWLCTMLLG